MPERASSLADIDWEYRICRGDSPGEVLSAVVLSLSLNPRHWWARGLTGTWRDEQGSFVYRTAPRSLLVTGANALAAGMRDLIAAGDAPGWGLVPLPAVPRPLSDLHRKLDPEVRERCAGLLRRSGFVSADEVGALPAECLLDIRGAGPKFAGAILNAAASLEIPRPLAPGLDAQLARLGLPHLRAAAPRVLAAARARPQDPADLLAELLAEEESGRARVATRNRA